MTIHDMLPAAKTATPPSSPSNPATDRSGGRFFSAVWRQPFVLNPWLLHAFFLVYAVNCVVFYQDRINLDVCQFLNSALLAHGTFFIKHGRVFIQLPPQILPWLAVHIDLPLKGVALAYSLGFCLYHWLMTLLLFYGFRRRDLATLLALIIVLHLVHNNFYIVADGMHIIPWALCMLAALQYPARRLSGRILAGVGAAAFALIAASSHLFGLPLSLSLGGYAFLSSNRRGRLLPALTAVAITLVLFYIWRHSNMDGYESKKVGQIGLGLLRRNGFNFVRYFVFAHACALAGLAVLAVLGWRHSVHRGAYWFSALCALGYAALMASYLPPFLHVYYWHCMMPMYAVLAAPFFDATPASLGARAFSRPVFAAALIWAVIGSAADLTAIRVRTAFHTNLINALPENENGDRMYIVEKSQFCRDYLSSFLTPEEISLRAAYDDPDKTSILISRPTYDAGYWVFSRRAGNAPTRYLPWFPVEKAAFIPAIIPASRAEILEQASQLSLDYPKRPNSVRFVDGWLCNYLRPLKMVYTVPVVITNLGGRPFPARDTEGARVMYGYYWHREGKILFQDIEAEHLPINVKTSFRHVLDVQRSGIPGDARLGVDLFLDGQPLLHPEAYYCLVPGGQRLVRKTQSESVIEMRTGFYNVEKSGVWLARQARFAFNRDLRRCSFVLSPPPNVDANHPADIEVRCEATGEVFAHRFVGRTPFTVTVDAPRAGQTVFITSTVDFCPARAGTSADTRSLALKLYDMKAVGL